MLDATKDTRLGNVYDVTAAIATENAKQAKDAVGLVIDKDGTLTSFTTENVRYGEYVRSPGFVGYLTAGSEVSRISARIAEAHRRVLQA